MSSPAKPTHSSGYQLFMLTLCVYSLAILALQAARPTDPATVVILEYADFMACLVFLADFGFSLLHAEIARVKTVKGSAPAS